MGRFSEAHTGTGFRVGSEGRGTADRTVARRRAECCSRPSPSPGSTARPSPAWPAASPVTRARPTCTTTPGLNSPSALGWSLGVSSVLGRATSFRRRAGDETVAPRRSGRHAAPVATVRPAAGPAAACTRVAYAQSPGSRPRPTHHALHPRHTDDGVRLEAGGVPGCPYPPPRRERAGAAAACSACSASIARLPTPRP